MDRQDWKDQVAAAGRYALAAARWLVFSAALGCVCGAAGAGFHKLIDLATELRAAHLWLLWLLPVGGAAVVLLYRLCRVDPGTGTNTVFRAAGGDGEVPIPLAPLIVVGTALSHLLGASVGREGAALQLGGSLGQGLARALRLPAEDRRVCAMCGMAACFSAMFGTPLTAAVFVVEVLRVGVIRYGVLLPCLCASCCAALTAMALGATPMRFTLSGAPALSWRSLGQVALLAVLCALVGILLCVALEEGSHLAKRRLKDPLVRVILGGAVMALLTVGLGLYDYAGAGTPVIVAAMAGHAVPWAFLVKLALTALCVAAGFRGGEIVPTLFVGATFGCWVGPLLGLDPGFGAAVGMVAVFCSAVNCPLASILLAAELFATHDLALFAVACVLAFVLSGYFSLYDSQTNYFSRVADRPLDRDGL